MANVTITTNYHWREFTKGYEFPVDDYGVCKMYEEFDYLTRDEFEEREFFKYKGTWYCVDQFTRFEYPFGGCPDDSPFAKWHGYCGDSFFRVW